MEEEEEEAAAAAEADVGEGGDEGWWSRKSRPPASRQRCRRSASMATRWSADEGKKGEKNASPSLSSFFRGARVFCFLFYFC